MYEDEPEITLQTLQDYIELRDIIEDFLRDKCKEYNNAKYEYSWSKRPSKYMIECKIRENKLDLKFFDFYADGTDDYSLPLDILFDDDFYEKMKAHFDVVRIESANRKRDSELKLLAELKKKYES